jgi:hypothetical protein
MRILEDRFRTADETMRSNGIAVVPRTRGQSIGTAMRARQFAVVQDYEMTSLFCETASRYGAGTITPHSPELVAEFSCQALARELNTPRLAETNDAFRVWHKKV